MNPESHAMDCEKHDKPAGVGFSRRQFLRRVPATAAATTSAWQWTNHSAATESVATAPDPLRAMLKPYTLSKQSINQFLDPNAQVWARFHPRYGYLLRNSFMRDGAFGCRTIGRYAAAGHRRQVNFPELHCRVNTYGDSFTQGHQVSDGETWQEVLAAHFCEPIRNFGIGGFGVYQAYRRLREIEATNLAAPYLIFNVWGDDHHRSIQAWRWLTFPAEVVASMGGEMFHANPWDYARLDAAGRLVEHANPCPTAQSLYELCDSDFVYEMCKDDPIVHALLAIRSGKVIDPDKLQQLATASEFQGLDLTAPSTISSTAKELYEHYAVVVGLRIFEALKSFVTEAKKDLFVLLSHPEGSVWHYCSGKPTDNPHHVEWHPARFKDGLKSLAIPSLDTVDCHVQDFQTFRGTPKEYVDKYYIGHYNPTGNHFFAFAIRDALLQWLDPAPPAYLESTSEALLGFDGYLPK